MVNENATLILSKEYQDKMTDILNRYFYGKIGIEIGGPSMRYFSNPKMHIYGDQLWHIPDGKSVARLDGVNFASSTVWTGKIDTEKGFVVEGKRLGNQYILDATDLSSIKEKYDFVLSCNNIEHIANPLKAVEQWLSILNEGGALVVIAPNKESNFDHKREIVKFEHLMDDFKNDIKEDDLSHLDEILTLHDMQLHPVENFRERSLNNFENRCLHQHCFDLNILKKIYEMFDLTVIFTADIGLDFIIIGVKKPTH